MITLVERPLVRLGFIHSRVLFVVVSLVAVAAIGVTIVGDVDVVMTICAVAVDVTAVVSVVAADVTVVASVVAADVTVVASVVATDVTVVASVVATDVTVVVTVVKMRGFLCISLTLHILLF